MTLKYAKVSEIAERFRVSADAVYLWIRQGKIPSDCVVRIAGTVRVDELQFEQRLRSGSLSQARGRKRGTGSIKEQGRPNEVGNVQTLQPFTLETVTEAK